MNRFYGLPEDDPAGPTSTPPAPPSASRDPQPAPARWAARPPRAPTQPGAGPELRGRSRTPCAASPAWPASGRATGSSRSAPDSGSLTLALARDGGGGDRGRGRPPPAPGAGRGRGAGRRAAGRRRRPRPRLGGGARRGAPRAGGQPALQRRHRRWSSTCWPGAPRSVRMLVIVQREVGERLARRTRQPGLRHPLGEAGLVGRRPPGRARCPPTVFVPRPRVDSVLLESWSATSRPTPIRRPRSRWSTPASASGARCCASSLAGRVGAAAFEAAGIDPTARAERLGVEDWLRLARAAERRPDRPDAACGRPS